MLAQVTRFLRVNIFLLSISVHLKCRISQALVDYHRLMFAFQEFLVKAELSAGALLFVK